MLMGIIMLLSAMGCAASEPREHHFSGPTMGTWYNVKVIGTLSKEERSAITEAIQDALEEVNALMSTYREDSELSKLNRHPAGEPFALSPETLLMLEKSKQVSRESNGAFDVTIGPLVNVWGFGPDHQIEPPDDTQIAVLLEIVGYEKLTLDLEAGTVTKKHSDTYIDLSGIAKGYAVDVVAETVESFGLENILVDIGGEVVARGHNAQNEPWRIAIETPVPDARSVYRVLPITDIALATSGDYRNFIEVAGRSLSHTIDPESGRPIFHDLASVSVFHESCALADAYATAILVLGTEDGLALAEELDLAVMLLVHDEEEGFIERSSSAFQALFPDS